MPAFTRSADFALDKPAGQPCPNLQPDFRCGIHTRLRDSGFTGCTVYDCFGAGQQLSQVTFEGKRSPRIDAVFPIMRNLHELLYYVNEAAERAPSAELSAARERLAALTGATPDELERLDVDALRVELNPLLVKAGETVAAGAPGKRKDHRGGMLIGAKLKGADLRGASLRGAYLLGADLRGADLRLADLIGADLRGADLRGADLTGAIFLTQSQLDAAKGDRTTRLPGTLSRPSHWR
ncbi:pentapeptide repeat-containing protein [Nonomuraea sp. NPDC050310]|uniref:pentapeptide repeat-containing protein n=1 Tax=Nonomuraea sp. NPDC050310 TaxID=3154935 RepID=UPI0033D04224